MVDRLVENALIALLQAALPTSNVVAAMEDSDPPLTLPAIVVNASIKQIIPAHDDIYELGITIEHKSVPGNTSTSSVDSDMQAIDTALLTPSTATVTGLTFLGWQGLDRSQQQVSEKDRRTESRELTVFATIS